MTTLTKWTRADNYAGQTWNGWLLAPCAITRDSDTLDRSNWSAQWDALAPTIGANGVEDNDGQLTDTVQIVRNGHWACGWLEFVVIHPSNTNAVTIAENLASRLANYPSLDDDTWSGLQWDEGSETAEQEWKYADALERLNICRRLGVDVPSYTSVIGPESSAPDEFVSECVEKVL